jgi:hypothetical protein
MKGWVIGQTATNQFVSTAIILILVSLMPPNRPDRWLGGRGTDL